MITNTKSNLCILASLALGAICPFMLAQETFPRGIVYGPKAAFKIHAPEGWVLDNKSGVEQGFHCVLYPQGSSWSDAKTAMYAKIASTQFEDVNEFVAWAIKEMEHVHGKPKEKIASGKTVDGHDYFINEYPATKTYSQWERVGYVQLPRAVAFIVLTSRDRANYQKDSGALQQVLKTFRYVEPELAQQKAKELSTKQDGEGYAARFKELQSQEAAGAQIDSLLDEWRAQKPDDPEGWITSANYYFNQRQLTFSAKKPGPGDIEFAHKETGKRATLSFGQAEGSMKRATDLLEEATTRFPDHLDIWCGLAFMYQESGDFDNELATLKKMVAYAREHPTQLKWLKGAPLGEPADQFVPEKLHEYGQYYEKKGNSEDNKRWFQISSLATEQYPNHLEGFNDAAVYWADIGEWQKARELLERAHQISPKTVGVLVNLGKVSVEMKDFTGARKYFEEAVKLDPSGDYGREAKEALRKLKKK
jgi:tetratricopeptide (TPR) repeat protein